MKIQAFFAVAMSVLATFHTGISVSCGKDVLSLEIDNSTITIAASDNVDFTKVRIVMKAFSENPIFSDDIKRFEISSTQPHEPRVDTPYIQLIWEKPMEMRIEATGSTRNSHINILKDAFKDQGISLFHMRIIGTEGKTNRDSTK
jgi:hypothetical protein